MSDPAGWYAHPEGQQSYWDGRQWTHRWVPGIGSVPWKDNEASSGPGAEQPSESATAQLNEAWVVVSRHLESGGGPMMHEPSRPPDPEDEPPGARRQEAKSGEKSVFWSPKVLGPIAALVLALGLVWAYGGSQWAGQQSGADPAVKAAACARAATITTQLADMREQMRLDSIKDGPIGSAQERQDLERQMEPLRVELVVQNKVCKG